MAKKQDKIKIIALGGGACKILQVAAKDPASAGMDLIGVDTNADDLEASGLARTVLIGTDRVDGEGCGGDPRVGEQIAAVAMVELKALIEGGEMVIVVAALGRGTGTGCAKAIARLARDTRAISLFFVTLPYAMEGNNRRLNAERALKELRQSTDIVVPIPNDLLFTRFPADTTANDIYALANREMASGVLGLAHLNRCRDGIFPVDLASLRQILTHEDTRCAVGVGRARGKNKVKKVIERLLDSPLLGGPEHVQSADAVVATLVGGAKMSIGEIHECLDGLNKHLNPAANTVIGAHTSDAKQKDLQVTLLTVHYGTARARDTPESAANVQLPDTPTGATGSSRSVNITAGAGVQDELPFVDTLMSLGIFGNTSPTTVKGQNLDIPTFQRLGVVIQHGNGDVHISAGAEDG